MSIGEPNLSAFLASLVLGLLVVFLGLVAVLWSALVAGLLWRSTAMLLSLRKDLSRRFSASDVRFLRSIHIELPH